MNDPQTWTTVWELTAGARGERVEEEKGENCDNCNRITMKN